MANTMPLSVSRPSRDHYDVIIVGSGMGGGTLAFALKDAGITRAAHRTWRIRAAGSRRTGTPSAVFAQGRYKNAEHWYDDRRPTVQPRHLLLRRRQHQVLRIVAGAVSPRRLPIHHPPRRGIARLAVRVRRPRPALPPRRSRSTRCTATSMTRRCSAANRSRSPASVTNRRCKRWPTGCASWATPRRRSRSASICARADPAFDAPPATASRAERWPSRMPTCPAYVPPSPAAPSNSSPTPVSIGC